MKHYNSNTDSEKFNSINQDINQVSSEMKNNLEPLLDRESKIELLVKSQKQMSTYGSF